MINAFAVPGGYIFRDAGPRGACRTNRSSRGSFATRSPTSIEARPSGDEQKDRGIRADAAFGDWKRKSGNRRRKRRRWKRSWTNLRKGRASGLLSYESKRTGSGQSSPRMRHDPFGLVRISERVARVSSEATDIFDALYAPGDAVTRSERSALRGEEFHNRKAGRADGQALRGRDVARATEGDAGLPGGHPYGEPSMESVAFQRVARAVLLLLGLCTGCLRRRA